MYKDTTNKSTNVYLNESAILNLVIPHTETTAWNCHAVEKENVYLLRDIKNDNAETVCVSLTKDSNHSYCLHALLVENGTSCNFCQYVSRIYSITLVTSDYPDKDSPLTCNTYHCGTRGEGKKHKGEREPQVFIVGIVVGIFCIGGFLIGLCLYLAQIRQQRRENQKPEEEEMKKLDSDQGPGPIEDFKDIPSGEIQIYTEEIQ